MNEIKLKTFLYSCQKQSLKLHFNNDYNVMSKYMFADGKLEDKTFLEAIIGQKNMLDNIKTGICFSMAAWVFELLYSMGIEEYYFMESKNSKWSNFVILFKTDEGYRICDMAAEVRKNERLISKLMDASLEEIGMIQERLKDQKLLIQTPEEYIKEYPMYFCQILLHEGNENSKYYDVPRISLKEFLEKQSDYGVPKR